MKAIERVEAIRNRLPFKNGTPLPANLEVNGHPDGDGFTEEYEFMLRAFDVMREIAANWRCVATTCQIPVETQEMSRERIKQQFEEWMEKELTK